MGVYWTPFGTLWVPLGCLLHPFGYPLDPFGYPFDTFAVTVAVLGPPLATILLTLASFWGPLTAARIKKSDEERCWHVFLIMLGRKRDNQRCAYKRSSPEAIIVKSQGVFDAFTLIRVSLGSSWSLHCDILSCGLYVHFNYSDILTCF